VHFRVALSKKIIVINHYCLDPRSERDRVTRSATATSIRSYKRYLLHDRRSAASLRLSQLIVFRSGDVVKGDGQGQITTLIFLAAEKLPDTCNLHYITCNVTKDFRSIMYNLGLKILIFEKFKGKIVILSTRNFFSVGICNWTRKRTYALQFISFYDYCRLRTLKSVFVFKYFVRLYLYGYCYC